MQVCQCADVAGGGGGVFVGRFALGFFGGQYGLEDGFGVFGVAVPQLGEGGFDAEGLGLGQGLDGLFQTLDLLILVLKQMILIGELPLFRDKLCDNFVDVNSGTNVQLNVFGVGDLHIAVAVALVLLRVVVAVGVLRYAGRLRFQTSHVCQHGDN